MREFFSFWWLCLKRAFIGSFSAASTWQSTVGTIGAIVLLANKAAKWGNVSLNAPLETIINSTAIVFLSLWVLAFIIHLLNAPVMLYQEEKSRADNFELQLDDRQKIKELRGTLGRFLVEGNELRVQCEDRRLPRKPPPIDETNLLIKRIEQCLKDNLDESYIASLHNDTGLPDLNVRLEGARDHSELWSYIGVRTARLQQFIDKLGG